MKYEIDVERIEAGDTIGQEVCESIIGFPRTGNEYRYQFELLQLQEQIQSELWKIGKRFTLRISNGKIEVLTHAEASQYNQDRFENAKAKMRRCHKRLTAVDVGSLTPEQLAMHNQAIVTQSRILQHIKTRQELTLEPTKRTTPTRVG